jgi:UDP-N-acetylglucosamine--N-acetylmuramyl-(pentapeptide) pyrophosphoryl-undecaprenol N-acetylglucosamine transferase
VSDALRAEAPCRFAFVGGRRGLENRIIPASGIAFHRTLMPSLRDPESRLSLVRAALALPISLLQALFVLLRERPRAVLTSGGLVSLPVVLAAALARVPVVIWNGDAVPGRVNRLLARFARRVAATFPEEERYFPRDKVVVTGNPVRAELLRWTRASGRAALDLPGDARVVLVGGGSQGSQAINAAVDAALTRLLASAYVVHLTGEAYLTRAEARRGSLLPAERRERYRPYAFLREEMGAALAAADLMVGRAGSGTIAEALALGLPLVLIPFGVAASGHQLANARSVVDAGAAVLVRESELDGDRLSAVVVGLLEDRDRLARMRTAAARAGRPDAATRVARLVLEVAPPPAVVRERRPMAEKRR